MSGWDGDLLHGGNRGVAQPRPPQHGGAASLQQKAERRVRTRGKGHLALVHAVGGTLAVLNALGEVLKVQVAAPNAAIGSEPARHRSVG